MLWLRALNAVHTRWLKRAAGSTQTRRWFDQQGQNLNNAIAAYKAQAEKYQRMGEEAQR